MARKSLGWAKENFEYDEESRKAFRKTTRIIGRIYIIRM